MTTVRVEYTLEDSCLTARELLCRVLLPALFGTAVIVLMRYAFNAWPAPYNKVSRLKDLLAVALHGGVACLVYRSLFAGRQAAKAHFLHTFLKRDSVLHQILAGNVWTSVTSTIGSLVLVAIAYIVIQTYSWMDIVAIACASAVGLFVSQVVGYLATDSLRTNVSTLLLDHIRRRAVLILVLVAVILTTIAQDSVSQWGRLTDAQLEARIKQEVQHPVLYIQQATRALTYFNVEIVRARDSKYCYPYGWIVYLFFLTPNTIPLYGIVCIYLGCDFRRRAAIEPFFQTESL
jgi:hypothetical protein